MAVKHITLELGQGAHDPALVVDHGGDGGCLVLDGVALVDVLLDGDALPRSLHTDNLRKAGSGRP